MELFFFLIPSLLAWTLLPQLLTGMLGVDTCRRNTYKFLISKFRRVMNIVCFLLGDSPASEFYMLTFRNTLSVPSS